MPSGAIREWGPVAEFFARPPGFRHADLGSFTESIHDDDRERVLREVEAAFAGDRDLDVGYRISLPEGRERWVTASGRLIRDESGRPRRMVGIARDATAERQGAEASRRMLADLARAQGIGKIGSWRLNVQRDELIWSEENHRIFGVSAGTPLTYEAFLAIAHPDDREYVDRKWQAGMRGEPYDIEHRILVDGQVRWVRERAELEFGPGGELLGGYGTTQDITEKKAAEQALRDSEQHFRLLVEQAVDGIFIADAMGRYIDVNAAGCAMLGYSREEILCLSIPDVIAEEEVPRLALEIARFSGGAVVRSEWLFRRKDGTFFPGEITGRQLPDGRLQAFLRDITERKDAEKALRDSEERLAAFTAATFEGIVFSEGGRIVDHNEQFARMTGFEGEDLKGRSVENFIVPEDRERVMMNVLSGRPSSIEHAMLRKDGSRMIVQAHGRTEGTRRLSVVRDITAIRQKEQEAWKLHRTLRALGNSRLALAKTTEEIEFLQHVCDIVVDDCGHARVWIGMAEESGGAIRPMAFADRDGAPSSYGMPAPCDDEPAASAHRGKEMVLVQDIREAPSSGLPSWRAEALGRGYTSVVAFPLRSGAESFGAITIFSRQVGPFGEDEIKLLSDLSEDVAFGIRTFRLRREHAQAEAALREREEYFRVLFERSPVSIWEEDFSEVRRHLGRIDMAASGDLALALKEDREELRRLAALVRVVNVNQRTVDFLGAGSREEVQDGILQYLDEAALDVFADEIAALANGATEFSGEAPQVTRGGERKHIAFRVVVVPGFERTWERIFVSLIDITDRKRDEDRIREFNEELERRVAERTARLRLAASVFQATQEAIAILDLDGTIRSVNPAFTRITGYTAADVHGKGIRMLASGPSAQDSFAAIWKELRARGSWRGELGKSKKNGEAYTAWLSIDTSRDADGKAVGYVAVFTDVTEQRNMEVALREARKMEAVGRMAGGMAHEFNNILVPMIGLAELVRDELPEGGDARSHLDIVLKAGERARQLITKILAFSHRKFNPPAGPTSLTHAVRDAMMLLRTAVPRGIEVTADLPEEELSAVCDPDHILQIIMNLGANARDAIGDRTGGVIEVSLSRREIGGADRQNRAIMLRAGTYACLRVRDNGRGMGQATIEHVFEPFFTTKDIGKGTGMGLPVVHGIVTQYGGTITASSILGKGTTIEVLLPMRPQPQPPGKDS